MTTKIYNLYEWADIWLDCYVKEKVRESTFICYSCIVKLIKQYVPNGNIAEYNELLLQCSLVEMFRDGYSHSTITKVKIVLVQIFHKAIKNKIATDNPAEDLFIPKSAPAKEVKPLTVTEQMAVEQACRYDIHGKLIIFLLYTGLRRNELCNLKWEDYNQADKTITIRAAKTKAGARVVPLLPCCIDIIEARPKINEFIFNSTKGNPITASVLKKTYLRLRKSSEVGGLTNHVCRHTFATRMVENGADIKAVSAILGHTSTSFTQNTYVTAQLPFLRQQISLLDKKKNHIANVI